MKVKVYSKDFRLKLSFVILDKFSRVVSALLNLSLGRREGREEKVRPRGCFRNFRLCVVSEVSGLHPGIQHMT